ncbi:MAG: DUF927 domain-containing protein [Clostridiales bacterium]|nr:DUF927 domain-containing protein [Clostridiales bacterium]
MKPINEYTNETILSAELIAEVFAENDKMKREELLAQLGARARTLRCKTEFTNMVKTYQAVKKEAQAQERSSQKNRTNLLDCPLGCQLDSGMWRVTDGGIFYDSDRICYQPILITARFRNIETGEEQVELAFKRRGNWEKVIVPKTVVASANKIVGLSGKGVAVTSETAKYLVQYLSDIENLNEDIVPMLDSSHKLGWVKNCFVPYDSQKVIFDARSNYSQLYDSVCEQGNYDVWLKHIRELRKSGRIEVKFMLAASFASVLIDPLGGLPFIADLWGETEGGKTVTLMLAASVWANPDESKYIGDFKSTDVALEAKADVLNSLPMILDDTSKTSARIRDNFEGVVYDLCSGKGKSRSNKNLGVNRENHWANCILCNGERPLTSYVNQGGAINRILEIECGEKVFANPQKTVPILKANYGHAGRRFVEIIKEMGVDRIRAIYEEIREKLYDASKMEKQMASLATVLTADKIVTDMIFGDQQYIPIDQAKEILVNHIDLSDNERAYQFLLEKVKRNPSRFTQSGSGKNASSLVSNEVRCEQWGIIEKDLVYFYNSSFEELCNDGHFSKKAFLSWASRKNLILCDNSKGRKTKQKKIGNSNIRCICLKLDLEMWDGGFQSVPDVGVQEVLPFYEVTGRNGR